MEEDGIETCAAVVYSDFDTTLSSDTEDRETLPRSLSLHDINRSPSPYLFESRPSSSPSTARTSPRSGGGGLIMVTPTVAAGLSSVVETVRARVVVVVVELLDRA